MVTCQKGRGNNVTYAGYNHGMCSKPGGGKRGREKGGAVGGISYKTLFEKGSKLRLEKKACRSEKKKSATVRIYIKGTPQEHRERVRPRSRGS